MPQHDIPFTSDGIQPDLIINPHAIPSRMTIGQLLESIFGKVGCMTGEFKDGTPFGKDITREEVTRQCHEVGFQSQGEEAMISGITGEPFEGTYFIGVCFYERLKHMVDDKKHGRSRGPVQILTRQPVEGRSRDGGLRFGEMEHGCLISYGVSELLKERMLDSSDAYELPLCMTCGFFAIPMRPDDRSRFGWFDAEQLKRGQGMMLQSGMPYCPSCCSTENIGVIRVPYAFKLLVQELYGMLVAVRLSTEKDALCYTVADGERKTDVDFIESRFTAKYLESAIGADYFYE